MAFFRHLSDTPVDGDLLLAGVGAYVSNNIWIASRASRATHALPLAKVGQADANRQLRNVLVRAGLGADTLAAAGVNSAKTAEDALDWTTSVFAL